MAHTQCVHVKALVPRILLLCRWLSIPWFVRTSVRFWSPSARCSVVLLTCAYFRERKMSKKLLSFIFDTVERLV